MFLNFFIIKTLIHEYLFSDPVVSLKRMNFMAKFNYICFLKTKIDFFNTPLAKGKKKHEYKKFKNN